MNDAIFQAFNEATTNFKLLYTIRPVPFYHHSTMNFVNFDIICRNSQKIANSVTECQLRQFSNIIYGNKGEINFIIFFISCLDGLLWHQTTNKSISKRFYKI